MRPNGPAIRAIRKAQNLSLRGLQQQTGLNRGYLSRMERGLIRQPADDQVRKVADVLAVPLAAITHEENLSDQNGHSPPTRPRAAEDPS
ncbi:helix-turn-helix transcriptional regulator [Streptomyces odorifer]|uniref:Helix-turn-helix transcriptional regulator n=1 Tax=Streptomyces odorifer TaxID=53450 RepID=A0A7Y6F511_9ACTN|nr:helix-turn-helix transcriptional regulator [Streptomyces odorifer]